MPATTVHVDYPSRDRVAGMVIGGMTVVERVLRDAARAGASHAIVRGDTDHLPALGGLPIAVEILPIGSPIPDGASAIAGDVIAGVQISDEDSRRAAARALFQTCRRPYDGIGDRYVIRAISLRITRVLCRLGMTPNQVTAINVIVGLAACGFAQHGTGLSFAIAGALMFLQVVLDSCDGELARIRHLHSRFGMWLDSTSDDVIDNLFVAMLGIGLGGIWAPLGIAAACGKAVSAVMIHVDVARRGRIGDVFAFRWWFDPADDDLAERFQTGTSLLGALRAVGRRDLYVLVWSATCVAGVPLVGLWLGLVLGGVYFGLAVAHGFASRGARVSEPDRAQKMSRA